MYSPPPTHLFFCCLFVFFLSKQYIMHVSGGFPVSFVRKFVRIIKKKNVLIFLRSLALGVDIG